MRNKNALRQVLVVSACELIAVGLMIAVYALIGKLNTKVLLGAAFGCVVSILNFFALTVTVSNAADKAEKTGNAAAAKRSIQASSMLRLFVLLVLYVLVLSFKAVDPIASVLPLIFLQISIRVYGFFRKEDETEK
ncbi:MAG: ATP synthase subunit I [Oscillospiraceae bacterium]|nr:ATP synthase subunit I [Oscillospiraceae bacterium]MBQ3986084.1 ATP synthase subunit I [Oscillospiraceae bacterium]